jgi:hypothetical protein
MKRNTSRRGGRRSTASPDKQMKAYDALPREIREALANAAYSYAPYTIWRRFKRGYLSAQSWVGLIQRWDAMEIARVERDRERRS